MTVNSLLRASCCLVALSPSLAFAQSDAQRIAALEARVAELENTDTSGSPELTFGSETATSVEIYGYIKTDFVADFGAELGNTTFGMVGVDDDDQGDFFNATAQQTRIGLRTTTPTSFGDLGTQVELDFYGGTGAFGTEDPYSPRVRHATATLGGIRVGKYWTTFMPLSSYPITLDFQGVAGIPFARQEQIRYTHDMGDFSAAVAIEESNGDSDDPVFIGALAYDTDPLLLRVSALYSGDVETSGVDANDAYGFNLSTTAQLWEGATLDAAYTYGEGIASYLVFLGDDVAADGDLIEQQAAYAGITQTVGEKWTFRAIYGWRQNDEEGPNDDTDTLTSLHLNAEYQVLENVSTGIEYYRGTREDFDGNDFEVDRIQGSVQISF